MDPAWPPDPPPGHDGATRSGTSAGMLLAGAGLGVALLLTGFGVAYLLFGDDGSGTEPAAIASTTTEAPAAVLPDDFPVEVGLQFFDDTPPAHREAVRTQFEQSGLFDSFEFEYFGPLDDGPWNTITGSGRQDDAVAICDFGRLFLADPFVDGIESRGTNECPDL